MLDIRNSKTHSSCMGRKLKFSEQLRRHIEASAMSRYRICLDLGFSESVLSRFMARKVGLSLKTVDELVEKLDLELVARGGKRKRGR